MSKIIKKCKECGSEIICYPSRDKKFCNVECYAKHIKGENNPFYGKTHSKETKRKIGLKNSVHMLGENNPMNKKNVFEWMVDKYGYDKAKQLWDDKNKKFGERHRGKNNPFYKKTHSKESINKIIRGNEIARMNPEFVKSHSIACSNAQQKLRDKNPMAYSEMKRKAGIISHKNQHRYKMNKPERKFADFLELNKIEYEYSPIMSKFQYDFKIKDKRILIEIDGDYWHGNPKFYTNNDIKGKRKLNQIQIDKQINDRKKEQFAEHHRFKLIRIWESDLSNSNILNEVLSEIQT